MQMSNGRKTFYITVSILLSFVIWFLVNSSKSVNIFINDIPVEFYNAESALANKGLVLINGDNTTVNLELSMPRNLVYAFDTEHVRVMADLNSVNSTGSQTVRYTISYPSGINPSLISVRSPSVQNVSVLIGSLFRRDDVEIRCNVVGTVAPGYSAGSVQLTPNTLEIWGQQSDVMKVQYALVTLNIDNANSTIVELLKYELYDYNDKLIESKNLHSASDTIQATMPVVAATEVPLVVKFIEAPGVRLDSFDYTLDTNSITLSGDANLVAQAGEIVLGSVDLTQIEDEQVFTYDVLVPDGLTNLSGTTTATLVISNRNVETKNIVLSSFEYENSGEQNRNVEIVTSSLSITLRGPGDVLKDIEAEHVRAVADLSGVADASGVYTVPARILIDGDPDVGTVQNYQLTVRIEAGESSENSGENAGGEQSGGDNAGDEDMGNDTNSNG